MVGRRHRRKARTPQAADRGCGNIPKRICRTCGRGRSSINHQQSLQSSEPATNNDQHGLGALSTRGTAGQGTFHSRLVHHVCEELDRAALGQSSVAGGQNGRGRALATGDRRRGWDQSQDQMRHVGSVLARGPLGILQPQPDLIGNTGWERWQTGSEYGRTGECQASEVSVEIDGRAGSAGFDRARVPRSAAGVSGCGSGDTSRRTGRTSLDGLRLYEPGLRYPTFLLLASRRASDRYQVGGFGSATADASGAQRRPAGVEKSMYVQPAITSSPRRG